MCSDFYVSVSTLLRSLGGGFYCLSFIIKMEQNIIEKLHGFLTMLLLVTVENAKCIFFLTFVLNSIIG